MTSDDLVASARVLIENAKLSRGRPRQTDLRRAISTAYYAMFHELCRTCADMVVGGAGSDRSDGAWRQVYRSLQHGDARKRCRQLSGGVIGFPAGILIFAQEFAALQEDRHVADYDPVYRTSLANAEAIVIRSERAISASRAVPSKDRRAFCVWVLFGRRL